MKKENNINFTEEYLKIKKEYETLKEKYKNDQKYSQKQKYIVDQIYILSKHHHHRLSIIKKFGRNWKCDKCLKEYNYTIPSYYCSLCAFDLCFFCSKNSKIEGNINKNIEK